MSPGDLDGLLAPLIGDPSPDLLVGFDTSDDAGVYRLDAERALVVTADFITPVVDDPRTFGRVAAANSLSDVYAMGAQLSQRLIQTSVKVGHLAFFDVTGRIARTLLDLCK